VLFYLIDTARFDRFSVNGYDHLTSPNLAKLASQGLLLTGGNAPASSTIPSVSALFASRHPSELGGRLDRKRSERKTLAEAFRDAGYATAAFQANYLLKRPMGYARGFDTYEIVTGVRPTGKRTAWADELHEPAIAWLRANADQPFFLYLQSMDVHHYHAVPLFYERFRRAEPSATGPETAPGNIDIENLDAEMRANLRSLSDLYDASIAYADHEIGNLLAVLTELGIAEKTVVVVTSDHGEPLGQRGALLHGESLFQELVHVPVVIHLPWLSEGRRIEQLFSLIDLGPTVADLVGVPIPAWWSGRSLLRPGSELRPPSAVGAIGVVRWGRRRKPRDDAKRPRGASWFVREGDWKLIQDRDGIHLFHIPSDPGEERDRQAEHPILAQYLVGEIARRSPSFRVGWQKPQALEKSLANPDREELQKALRSLG
jgi:arylsulfatase A-like enzyme